MLFLIKKIVSKKDIKFSVNMHWEEKRKKMQFQLIEKWKKCYWIKRGKSKRNKLSQGNYIN